MAELAKVVVRYRGGMVIKGYTSDFFPDKPLFHLRGAEIDPSCETMEVRVKDLKAVFFVRDFEGDAAREDRRGFTEKNRQPGRRAEVAFIDGEILAGTILSYDRSRLGFFLFPADREGNNDRVFVINSAVASVDFLPAGK